MSLVVHSYRREGIFDEFLKVRCMSLWCSLIVLSSRLVFSHGGSPGSAGSGALLPGNHASKTTHQDPYYTVENTPPTGSGLCWGNHSTNTPRRHQDPNYKLGNSKTYAPRSEPCWENYGAKYAMTRAMLN